MAKRLCLAALVLTSVGCGGGEQPSQKVAVEDIWRALSASEAAAMDRYGGRPLLVEGTVDSISNPGGARPTYWLRTPDLRASAPAFIVGEVARPSSGSRVILRCEYLQHVATTPYFYSCEIAG